MKGCRQSQRETTYVFSAAVAILPHRALTHPNGQKPHGAGSRLQAAADEAAPKGRMPGMVLGLLAQCWPLAVDPSVDHRTKGSAAWGQWVGRVALTQGVWSRWSPPAAAEGPGVVPKAPLWVPLGHHTAPMATEGRKTCPHSRCVLALKILGIMIVAQHNGGEVLCWL